MKKYFCAIPLVFLLCITFGCQKGEEVAEKSVLDIKAEKEAVAKRFQDFVETAVGGDIEKLRRFYHPEMSWWDFSQEHPVGIEAYMKGMEEFYKSGLKWVCDLGLFEIHVAGDAAVLYTTYKNIFKDPEGNETASSGRWTAVLTKQDGKWLLLSNSFTEKL
jgi:uncharacterized protein (TIGR02246 family)